MPDLTLVSRESLAMQSAAFRAARDALTGGHPAAAASVRRLATAMQRLAARHGLTELEHAAAEVVGIGPDGLVEAAARLDAALGALAEGVDLTTFVILVVEDDADTRLTLELVLDSPHHQLRFATNVAEGRAAIEAGGLSLVILDLTLPDGDGRDLIVTARGGPGGQGLPIIVVSGLTDPRVKAECFALGADEFVDKPLDPPVFRAAIESRLKRTLALTRESQRDALTGLPTRAAFERVFDRVVAAAGQRDEQVSLALLDLDHFKRINDEYGHAAGDEVLRRLSRLLEDGSRSSDHVARWGGEEFVLLFRGGTPGEAAEALDRMRQRLRGERFREHEVSVTFSAGVVGVARDEALDKAVSRADAVLYEAKRAGRDRVQVAGLVD